MHYNSVRKTLIIASLALASMLSARIMWEGFTTDRIAHDYAVYWRTANDAVSLTYATDRKPFPYAPMMLLWIAPLGLVTRPVGYWILLSASVAAITFVMRPYLTKTAIILALISPPMVRCFRNGQISALLAALLIWACASRNRIWAGMALGVIASIKPQLVVMAPLMLAFGKDWKALASAGFTLVALALLSLQFGPERWLEWVGSMDNFHRVITRGRIIDIAITPAAIAEHYGLPPIPFMIAGAATGALLVYLCRNDGPLERATAIGCGSLLASPYALAYDLVVIVPFAAILVTRGRSTGALAIFGAFNPLPLLLVGGELFRARQDDPISSSTQSTALSRRAARPFFFRGGL